MEEDYKQAVRTNLAANVAATYFNLIMYDRELKILQETQVVWEESLEAMRVLFEAGLYMSPAVYQMEASLASVQSGIVEVQENIRITEAALCLLLSEPPHPIERAQFGSSSCRNSFTSACRYVCSKRVPMCVRRHAT